MSLKHTILGFLSWRSLSGYDLKKLFVETDFVSWAGTSNQIYTTLVALHRDGFVTSEVEVRERGPARKLYALTPSGQEELHRWLISPPEPPSVSNAFLGRLAWADQLDPAELDALLTGYEEEVRLQLLMAEEQQRRRRVFPGRTPRESLLWDRIAGNRIAFFESELDWVRGLRSSLDRLA